MSDLQDPGSIVNESPLLWSLVDEPGSPEGSFDFATHRERETRLSLACRLVHADVHEVLPIGFGGTGSEGDINGVAEHRRELEIVGLPHGGIFHFEMGKIEPSGTFIEPVLARGVSDVRVKDGSISLANLDSAEVIPKSEQVNLKETR
jgi:hypothetical protein